MASNSPLIQNTGSLPTSKPRRIVTSAELLGDGKELIILHGGTEYRLMVTKQSKLILNK